MMKTYQQKMLYLIRRHFYGALKVLNGNYNYDEQTTNLDCSTAF